VRSHTRFRGLVVEVDLAERVWVPESSNEEASG